MTAATKRKLDARRYGQLLAEVLPRPIETEAEYERALEPINRLMSTPENKLKPEEDVLLELLAQLVERYEERHYPIPEAPPFTYDDLLDFHFELESEEAIAAFFDLNAAAYGLRT